MVILELTPGGRDAPLMLLLSALPWRQLLSETLPLETQVLPSSIVLVDAA